MEILYRLSLDSAENRMCLWIISKCSHALAGKGRNNPVINRGDYAFPTDCRRCVKSLSSLACQTGGLVIMPAFVGLQHFRNKFNLGKVTQFSQNSLGLSDEILITKEVV